MKSEFIIAFNQICAERNLPREVVLEAIETALVSAYRRNTGAPAGQNITAEIDLGGESSRIFTELEVVEEVTDAQVEMSLEDAHEISPEAVIGDMLMVESTPKDFGRIAAQTARQVILQRIREAEREAQFAHYIEQEGELVYGMVQSVNPRQVTLRLGRTEAVMPRKEQVPGERYVLHERIRAYVLEVRKTTRGPQIVVSRSHNKMLRRMLELEVPEIANGTVEIKSIAREAGSRSKVAVVARQAGVDPVGACVGMRGIRIQSIVKELGGEKVDIIEWSADPVTFIAKALSPARVLSVQLDQDPVEGNTANVVVPDDQLSLAIGRAGQNARLAAKLTGWRIDIQGISEAGQWALEQVNDDPAVLPALGPVAEKLRVVASSLRHHQEDQLPYNVEEMVAMREVIEGVRGYYISLRDAERARLAAQEASRRAALEEARVSRETKIKEAFALIPTAAYDLPVEEIGLSKRVLDHLKRGGVENVGHVLELLAEGDEGLLKLDGIGPRSLAEVKESLEQLDLPEEELEAEAELEAVVEVVEVAAPEVEAEVSAAEVVAEEPAEAPAPAEEPVAPAPAELPVEDEAAAVPSPTEPTMPVTEWEEEFDEPDDELPDEDEQERRSREARRRLVYDEETGEVVAVRRHRRGEDDLDDWEDLL